MGQQCPRGAVGRTLERARQNARTGTRTPDPGNVRRITAAPPRTRLIRDEHELGRWTRAVRTPDPRLRGLLYRDLLGFEQEAATFSSWLEPPRPAYTLIVDLEGSISSTASRFHTPGSRG